MAATEPVTLTYEEAEIVAEDLRRVWVGATGCKEVPTLEAVTDIVQRFARKSREVVAQRESIA